MNATSHRERIGAVLFAVLMVVLVGVIWAFRQRGLARPDRVEQRCGHTYRWGAAKKQIRIAKTYGGCPTFEEANRNHPLG